MLEMHEYMNHTQQQIVCISILINYGLTAKRILISRSSFCLVWVVKKVHYLHGLALVGLSFHCLIQANYLCEFFVYYAKETHDVNEQLLLQEERKEPVIAYE